MINEIIRKLDEIREINGILSYTQCINVIRNHMIEVERYQYPTITEIYNYVCTMEKEEMMGILSGAAIAGAITVTRQVSERQTANVVKMKEDNNKKEKENMGKIYVNGTTEWNKLVEELLNDVENVCAEQEETVKPKKITDYSLYESTEIIVPNKIDLFAGLDITERDRVFIAFPEGRHTLFQRIILLVNGEDNAVGYCEMKTYLIDGKVKHFLTAKAENIRFENHMSTKYSLIFADSNGDKRYRVPISVEYYNTAVTSTHLCIDFGTSNTTVGCYLDERYVNKVSNLAVINGNVELDAVNITKFANIDQKNSADNWKTLSYSNLIPTVVYVKDCTDKNAIKYAFGYEANKLIKEDGYCPKASCFMEIKRWTSDVYTNEDIQDRNGNKATVLRKDIIAEYLKFVIREAENQYKCKFKNVHISAPVKLKNKVLDIYADILKEYNYTLEKVHAIDEGIAVLYSIINNQIKDGNYVNGEKEKALIIDCGGGTSDLASCEYDIEKDEDGIINLNINTEYMNGDVNFGGNNLTYRIMQYMKVVYAQHFMKAGRPNIDTIINVDTNSIFSFIEGELENDDDARVIDRYEEVYKNLNEAYEEAEKVLPTRYSEYENQTSEVYNRVKNNFYFLWKLAEEMKKEFYRTTSISRYKVYKECGQSQDIDLHVNRIEQWKLSVIESDRLKEQPYPDITFTAKEIDKLLRADIYYLVRKFLNDLYIQKKLDSYSQIKLSGQSSKINIFMDSLKEFLPGKKIKSGRISSKGNDAEDLKLLCLKGAIMYLHALEMSNIEVKLSNDIKNIPISVYIKTQNDEDKEMIKQGNNWKQRATKGRITTAGKVVYFYLRNVDKEVGEPYKYVCENIKYTETKIEELKKISSGSIQQEDIDNLPENKHYFFVFLNKERWGFNIVPIYRDGKGKIHKGKEEFCSFEMDILQESFFDGRK